MRDIIENFYHRTSVMLWAMVIFGLIITPDTSISDSLIGRIFGFLIVAGVWYVLYGAVAWVFGLRRLVYRPQ